MMNKIKQLPVVNDVMGFCVLAAEDPESLILYCCDETVALGKRAYAIDALVYLSDRKLAEIYCIVAFASGILVLQESALLCLHEIKNDKALDFIRKVSKSAIHHPIIKHFAENLLNP